VLVTHEAEIAAYAHRTIHIRDGEVERDVASEHPPVHAAPAPPSAPS
jgi:ABC-type lipoprotein export system ATPase subunit